jgi:hypothetical protein
MKCTFAILLTALVATSVAMATTYVRVEKDGSKTYSDRPLPGGHPVELQSAQTYSSGPAPVIASGRPNEQQLLDQMSDFKYASCTVQPANDTTFTNPESISVSAALTPTLRIGDRITVSIDGTPIPGAEYNTYTTTMTNPPRGAHTVAVVVTNNYGKTLCNGSSTFYVQRPTVNSPKRR